MAAPTQGKEEPENPPSTVPKTPGALARALVPPDAWAVADFRGDLTGEKPFDDQEGLCASVPPPPRVVIAVLPPRQGAEPDLLIGARKVGDTFWGCARDRIVRAGGTALAQNERYEVLQSPTGVVARGPDGSMVFLTSDVHLEAALAVMSDLSPSAVAGGTHAGLYARTHERPNVRPSALDLTVALPENWLASVGQEAKETPLRFIRSAFLSVAEEGSAQGGITCEEAGCAEVLGFLLRAKSDMTAELPNDLRQSIDASVQAEHVVGSGRIAVTWTPQNLPLGQLLGRFLQMGPAPLAKDPRP